MTFDPTIQYQQVAQPPAGIQPGPGYESQHHQAWSEPVRQKIAPALAIALIVSGAFAPAFAPLRDTGLASGSWSQPPAQMRQVQYQAWAGPVFIGEASTPDKWYVALSEPVRIKPRLPEGEQQFLAYSESAQFPETVTESRWHQPWSEPVRFRPDLGASRQPFFAIDPLGLTRTESVTESRWHQPWSEPVRFKPDLGAARQPFFAIDPRALTTKETVTEDRWHQPWSEPVRFKPDIGAARQPFFTTDPFALTQPETVTESRWHQPWSEPAAYLVKRALPATEQHFVEFEPEPPIFDTVPWLPPLSEPVRVKARLLEGRQQFLAIGPLNPVVSFGWVPQLSEPVRVPARLIEAKQQFLAYAAGAIVVEPTLFSKWGYAWSEPVRQHPRLLEALQQFEITEEGFGPPPPPGSGRRKDFPSWIPQPAYDAKPAKAFRPVWDKPPDGEIEQHPTPVPAAQAPLPPASIFAPPVLERPMPAPGSPPPFGLPDFNNLVPPDPAGLNRRMTEAQDMSDAMAVLKALGLV